MSDFAVVIPTYCAGERWQTSIQSILRQEGLQASQVWVIDSSSQDETTKMALDAGFNVHVISKKDFNHGGTRQLAVSLLPKDTQIVLFLTQDAILVSDDAVRKLIAVFEDERLGCAYGRQLPHKTAGILAAHARLFNYGEQSYVRTLSDVSSYGIKTAFLSNSFAAYRVSALMSVGGFPLNTILAEDMMVSAKMLQANYGVAYVADACVYHSHDYTPIQEFQRYFDIGVLHVREPWLLASFGSPQGEGKRFVLSELRYVLKHAPWLLPLSVINTVMKYCGYHLGKREAKLSLSLKRRFGMYKDYWG